MGTTGCIILLFIVFFVLVIYLIHQDEKRKADRRLVDLPSPAIERRKEERRENSISSYFAWAMRSLGALFNK